MAKERKIIKMVLSINTSTSRLEVNKELSQNFASIIFQSCFSCANLQRWEDTSFPWPWHKWWIKTSRPHFDLIKASNSCSSLTCDFAFGHYGKWLDQRVDGLRTIDLIGGWRQKPREKDNDAYRKRRVRVDVGGMRREERWKETIQEELQNWECVKGSQTTDEKTKSKKLLI